MVIQIKINIRPDITEPFLNFTSGRNKELFIDDIIFYDDSKIVYRAVLKKSDFIDDIEKIMEEKNTLEKKYGIRYFEILNIDSTMKTYSVLIIQDLPDIASKLLSRFSMSVFIVPPFVLNNEGLIVNILTMSGSADAVRLFLDENKLDYLIIRVGTLDSKDLVLSDRERMILKFAFEYGYFEQPRKNTLEDLSVKIGVSKSTILRILRLAENKIIKKYFEEDNILE